MGCWDATCLVSNLAIQAGDKIRLILLERQVGDDFWYTYPHSAWRVIGLPVKGEYNDYGGITEVDATSPEAQLLGAIAKRLFQCGQPPEPEPEPEPEFTSVEAVADQLWQHSRWIYQKNEQGITVAGWAEVQRFDYDATGKYARVPAKGRDERGNLLPNHYQREFGYTLVLEEFYQLMYQSIGSSYHLDVAHYHQNIIKAVTAEKARQALSKPATSAGQPRPLSPAEQIELTRLQEIYWDWRRDFSPLWYEGFAELEALLLAEAAKPAAQADGVTTKQAGLSYALAEFRIFNEAMAIARRHYTPQSTGVQHDSVPEYEFHQTLARTIVTVLDKRIAEITAQPDEWADDADGWDEDADEDEEEWGDADE